MKICVATVEALRKKERGDETSVYHQNWWKNYFGSKLFRFVKFHSELPISWPTMPKPAVIA